MSLFAYTSLFVLRNDVIVTTKRKMKKVPRCSTSVCICQQSGLSLITITGLIHLYGTVFKNWIVFQIFLMHHPYLGLKGYIAFTAIAYFIILAWITNGQDLNEYILPSVPDHLLPIVCCDISTMCLPHCFANLLGYYPCVCNSSWNMQTALTSTSFLVLYSPMSVNITVWSWTLLVFSIHYLSVKLVCGAISSFFIFFIQGCILLLFIYGIV